MKEDSVSNAHASYTCLRLELSSASERSHDSFFIHGTWFPSHFRLSITDGLSAWTCEGSDAEVRQRAEQWDQSVSEYLSLVEHYIGFQQPDSNYGFEDAGKGHRRLSWTFVKQGTKLEWRWKCQPSSDSKQNVVEILNFLMDANIRLSEEVVRKTQSFEKLKVEAERCLSQSQIFSNEKVEFESAVYAKFIAVLNSKKAKLRELRDQLLKLNGKPAEDDDKSSNETERFDGGSDDDDDDDAVESSFKKSSRGNFPDALETAAASTSKGIARKR